MTTLVCSISFCAGADNSCVSRGGGAGIRTVANASLARPGVITHSYDSALAPQIGQECLFFKFFITCHREVDSRVRTLSGLHAGVLVRQYSNTGYLSSTILSES